MLTPGTIRNTEHSPGRIHLNSQKLEQAAERLQQHYLTNEGALYTTADLQNCLQQWLIDSLDLLTADAFEHCSSYDGYNSRIFRSALQRCSYSEPCSDHEMDKELMPT
ncbi:hypothetical protein BST81_03380 [Leptolyngbya sp. 'hensonii']|uniref:hypothetical protein n=1 Tax=Leptolyngbya sp. 'hensonii' TaxID=1922337 RepID=UPI00094F80E3|nr:hypothetical protein [Leptolyngbya sp. 'hensonii']OLP19828.1 hypothetical protein BST81_03380 [Leptolyngbya sp. 'hensonii']